MPSPIHENYTPIGGVTPQSYQNAQSPLDVSQSHSINTIPSLQRDYIVSEDLLAGQRLNGRMSNVRRFFCLFVTFDFIFTWLMWTICVMLKGEYLIDALKEQVVHYNIHTSLFDIVLLAFMRFLILILFYALISINHWIVISLSTTLTCGFLTAKVFIYDWPHSSEPAFEVLLLLTSFVLSWGEAWFLDFRVLPQESYADRFLISNVESERAPLIRSYIQGLPSVYTESVGNFYSPLPSPDGSLLDADIPATSVYPEVKLTNDQLENYKKMAYKAVVDSWAQFKKDDWKFEKLSNDNDKAFSRTENKVGRFFKIQALIPEAPQTILDELYYKVNDVAKWHSNIKESYKLQVLDEHTDISYQVSKEGGGGLVSSREFLHLRRWTRMEGTLILAFVSTEHPSRPKTKKIIRAEDGLGCWILESYENDPNKCTTHWILHTNLNIWVPKSVLEREMIETMFSFIRDLKQLLAKNGRKTD